MERTEFENLCDDALHGIVLYLDSLDQDIIFFDLMDGVLNITIDDTDEYVINRHFPTKQIWMSSPQSGASYFTFNAEQGKWFDRNNNELMQKISDEFESYKQ
jgi:iron donor protein CyaY